MRRLRELATRQSRTVVVVLHEVNYAATHAERIVVMKAGRVIFEAPAAEAITAERLHSMFDAPVAVHRIDGQPFVLRHA